MYFEIDETHPDITPVGSVMSWREGVLLSIIVHLVFVIIALKAPQFFEDDIEELKAKQLAELKQRQEDSRTRFVFVQPKIDLPAQRPPERAELSDQDRQTVIEIDAALARIETGDYGYSLISTKPIPRERLEFIPWATELVTERVGGIGQR